MASQEYYDNTGYPAFGSPGSSAPMRGEFVKIENGFGKLPDLSGNGGEVVTIKTDETRMESTPTTGSGNIVRATDPTFILSDVTTNNASTVQHGWMQKYPGGTTTFLRADGTFAAPPGASLIQQNRSSNTILSNSDNSTLINYTSGTFTQTLTAAATLGNGWFCYVRNNSTGNITFDPNGGELIDGATTGILRPGMIIIIICTGTAFNCIRIGPGIKEVLTSGTSWTSPLGVITARLREAGAGGSGGKSSGGAVAAGGGAGAYLEKLLALTPNTAYTYAIGTGGVSQSTSGTNGNNGGNTTITVNAVTYTAGGGTGGSQFATVVAPGGTATNGDINIRGGWGWGVSNALSAGGGNPLSPSTVIANGDTPLAGTDYGSGGTGAQSGQNSGAGANGVLILEY